MKIHRFKDFDELLKNGKEAFAEIKDACLTIGNFDGLHKGHLAVLDQILAHKKTSVVFTFSTHPAEILHDKKALWLTSLEHRLHLLEKKGIDHVIILPFSLSLSRISARDFLCSLKKVIPFSQLILGHDAVVGHGREGNAHLVSLLGKELLFSVTYLPPILQEEKIVSSSYIRSLIQEGKIELASLFLGRPFSVRGRLQKGAGKGKVIGFPTANLDVDSLCLPPLGVWEVQVALENSFLKGIANLGIAPTLHEKRSPLLEVHLLNFNQQLTGEILEVFFIRYIREEKKFSSIDALKKQIQQDVMSVDINR